MIDQGLAKCRLSNNSHTKALSSLRHLKRERYPVIIVFTVR